MRLPVFTKIRVPLLLVLILAEIGGIVFFFGSRGFLSFLYLSIVGTVSSSAIFWIERLETIQIRCDEVALYYMIAAPSAMSRVGASIGRLFLGLAIDIGVALLIVKFAPIWGNVEEEKTAHVGIAEYPLFAVVLAVMGYSGAAMFASDHTGSAVWSFPLIPPLVSLGWKFTLHRIEQRRMNPDGSLSITPKSN